MTEAVIIHSLICRCVTDPPGPSCWSARTVCGYGHAVMEN